MADPELAERLSEEISETDYESKIEGLLRRSFAVEVARDQQAQERWRQAWTVLNQGDHYILIMIGSRQTRKAVVALLVVGCY